MSTPTRIKIGAWVASPALNLLESGERSIKLEPRTMDVLAELAARPGDVVSVEELLAKVWRGVVVSDSSVYHAIKQLRQALEGSGGGDTARYIETIPKRGYRLVAPVERIAPSLPISTAAAVTGATPLPAPAPLAERVLPVRQPRARAAWLAAAFALALVVATAAWLRGGDGTTPAGGRQTQSARTLRFSIPIEGYAGHALSADGRYLAYSTGSTLEKAILYVRPLDSLEARPLDGTASASRPFWSPNGEQIGFHAFAEQRVKHIGLAGGAPQVVGTTPVGTAGSWNANGVILFDGSTGIVRVPAGGGEGVNVTELDTALGEVANVAPSFLPDGRRFLFANAFGKPGTYVGSLDSMQRTQVLPFSAVAVYASGYLLYSRGSALLAQPFDPRTLTVSGDPIQIADGLITDPTGLMGTFSASQNGVLAYATGDALTPGSVPRATQLAWYDRSGRRLEPVGPPDLYRGIELSPDGTRVAVHRHALPDHGSIWLHDLARGTDTRLSSGPAHEFSPVWSPDGAYIMYTGTNVYLYRQRADGIGEEEVVLDSVRVPGATDWAADGSVLVHYVPALQGDIGVLRLGAEPMFTPLLDSKFSEGYGVLSPDGGRLAYVSDESGRYEIYVRSYPDLAGKVRVSKDGGIYPRWSPDGRDLYFATLQGAMLVAAVGADYATVAVQNPRVLIEGGIAVGDHWGSMGNLGHWPYDVAPDGQRLLVNERIAAAPDEAAAAPRATIVVVSNWTSLLDAAQ
jgi:DNA-binding winged helix-turn-helix (wHTH) protein/Tol biopolymer transport system component